MILDILTPDAQYNTTPENRSFDECLDFFS